ncbi:MAG: hypothetical protein J6V37_04265, partial [Clostridia bacterium]|nr:hypothetical protein [Clostridia bacterium]
SLGYGTFPGLAAVQFVFLYIIYALVIRKALVKRGLIVSGEVDAQANLYNTKLLKKMILICGIIAGVLSGVLHIFISPHFYYNIFTATYNTVEEFKEHYESEYDEWCNEQKEYYWIKNEQGELVFDQEAYDDYCALRKDVGYLEDANGHAYEYYALSDSITGLTYERQGNKIWNIQVFDMDDTYACVQLVKDCFGFVFVLYFGVCAVIYKSKTDKNKKKVLAGADENKAEKPEFEELAAE